MTDHPFSCPAAALFAPTEHLRRSLAGASQAMATRDVCRDMLSILFNADMTEDERLLEVIRLCEDPSATPPELPDPFPGPIPVPEEYGFMTSLLWDDPMKARIIGKAATRSLLMRMAEDEQLSASDKLSLITAFCMAGAELERRCMA